MIHNDNMYPNPFPACNRNLNGTSGIFTSPNYPLNYPNDQNCLTKIVAPTGKVIKLQFATFSLEDTGSSCIFDYVEISDGTAVKKYCGKKIPSEFISKANTLEVKFFSDSSITEKGFSASYLATGEKCYFAFMSIASFRFLRQRGEAKFLDGQSRNESLQTK